MGRDSGKKEAGVPWERFFLGTVVFYRNFKIMDSLGSRLIGSTVVIG